jgi:hypothetical protein
MKLSQEEREYRSIKLARRGSGVCVWIDPRDGMESSPFLDGRFLEQRILGLWRRKAGRILVTVTPPVLPRS